MTVVFIPGFARAEAQLAHWRDLLPGDVQFVNLPGHGGASPVAPDLATLAAAVSASIPRDALVVAESISGIIALKMAAQGYRVVAVDPPLSTAKLWVMQYVAPIVISRNPHAPWMPQFVQSLFGIGPEGQVEERDYWPLLDDVVRPVDVIAASTPLWPVRPVHLLPETTPSVLDEVDGHRLSRHPNVRYQRLDGPHALLSERVDASREALLAIMAQA